MKTTKKEIIIIALAIVVQTVIFILVGMNKEYIHMDEAFSFGLTNYEHIKIQMNDDFYDTWHNKEYYEDYLIINEDEKFDFTPVYVNQKNDVHPPLYYFLLRLAMSFHIGKFSVWSGLILNMIIYVFITIFMYLIVKKLLEGQNRCVEKSIILALLSSITIASLNNMVYIRMYALSTLNIVITTYLHFRLLDSKEADYKLLTAIGISALVGSLTHYYYLFYLVMLFIMFAVKYIKEKQYKEFGRYFGALAIAGILSILIFPFSIQHMFFGYRGQGALSNLSHLSNFIKAIVTYLLALNRYGFNNILFIILAMMAFIAVFKSIRKIPVVENKYTKYIILPAISYFLLVSISSPWKTLRYIMPICGVVFIVVFYYLYELLKNIVNEKITNTILIVVFAVMLITPMIINIPIQEAYVDKKDIVEKISTELKDVPTIYAMRSKGNRFLDDILLFSKIENSYIAKDVEYNEENVKKIFAGKDLSKGIVVFINTQQNNNKILENIRSATNLKKCSHLKRMNACDIYYIK